LKSFSKCLSGKVYEFGYLLGLNSRLIIIKCELLSLEKMEMMHLFSCSSHRAGNWHSQVPMLLWPWGT